jgi:hypothetical protein
MLNNICLVIVHIGRCTVVNWGVGVLFQVRFCYSFHIVQYFTLCKYVVMQMKWKLDPSISRLNMRLYGKLA